MKLTKGLFIVNLRKDVEFLGTKVKYVCYCVKCRPKKVSKKSCTECHKHYCDSEIIEVYEFDKVQYYSWEKLRVTTIEDYHLSHQYPMYPKGLYYRKVCMKCIDEFMYNTF
ncbi:hypothetical protein CN291_20505 [Bacillus cereus]|nr:hypothetical protein CN291_20505 [Bacillus cereus]